VAAEPVAAELVERREVLPGQRIDAFHAPTIAVGARAGQLVALHVSDDDGLTTRRTCPINTADPATGVVTIHLQESRRRRGPEARLRPGDRVELAGPLGRPFELDPRSRHLLLVAAGPAIAGVRMLADEAIRDGRQVTVLFGAATAREVYPSTLLPDEVEYVVVTEDGSLGHPGSVADMVPGYEAWADQAFAAGPRPLLARLAALAAGRRARMGVAKLGRKRGAGRADPPGSPAARRKAFLQVTVELDLTCAAATCLGCAVASAGDGLLRACREGPVFAAEELDWESRT
jgi:dihydroorotate dehydrogenase electron transfer subunit